MKHNNRKTNKYDINKANINISINTVFKNFRSLLSLLWRCQVTWHHSPIALLKLHFPKWVTLQDGKLLSIQRIAIIMETRSLTSMNIHALGTKFTFDMATPVEFTVTFVKLRHSLCVVAPPTTHDVTSVCPQWCLVALATCCTKWPWKKLMKWSFLNVNLPKVT